MLRKNRRESYLYAEMLENEHKKARVILSMSPEEKKDYVAHEKRVDEGCATLHRLLERLKMSDQITMFKRRKITYDRAKIMTAREFVSLGLTHAKALRLANTLAYASTVEQSYKDAGATSPVADSLQKNDEQDPPVSLFPFGTYDRNGMNWQHASPSAAPAASARTAKPSTRRLSSMGRDLLGVFDQTYEKETNREVTSAKKFRHPNLKFS